VLCLGEEWSGRERWASFGNGMLGNGRECSVKVRYALAAVRWGVVSYGEVSYGREGFGKVR